MARFLFLLQAKKDTDQNSGRKKVEGEIEEVKKKKKLLKNLKKMKQKKGNEIIEPMFKKINSKKKKQKNIISNISQNMNRSHKMLPRNTIFLISRILPVTRFVSQ